MFKNDLSHLPTGDEDHFHTVSDSASVKSKLAAGEPSPDLTLVVCRSAYQMPLSTMPGNYRPGAMRELSDIECAVTKFLKPFGICRTNLRVEDQRIYFQLAQRGQSSLSESLQGLEGRVHALRDKFVSAIEKLQVDRPEFELEECECVPFAAFLCKMRLRLFFSSEPESDAFAVPPASQFPKRAERRQNIQLINSKILFIDHLRSRLFLELGCSVYVHNLDQYRVGEKFIEKCDMNPSKVIPVISPVRRKLQCDLPGIPKADTQFVERQEKPNTRGG